MDKKTTLLGLGGAGCRILSEISRMPAISDLNFLAVDTDAASLAATGLPPECCIQAAKKWRNGAGCGADAVAGQRSVGNERQVIREALKDTGILLVCGGLGGGVGSGGLPVILSEADKLHITVFVLVSLPFSMEGYRRRKVADDGLRDLLPLANALITIPNDLLFATLPGETPLNEAFKLADKEMARTVLALSSVLRSENLFSADIAALDGVFKRRSALCSIGIGTAEISEESAEEKAMEKLLMSPLLGGVSELASADTVIFVLTGGSNLSLDCTRRMFQLASAQLPGDSGERQVILGTSVLPEYGETIQLTAIALHYQDNAAAAADELLSVLPVPAPAKPRSRNKFGRQEISGATQLDLPCIESKGIMEGTVPVSYNGEDLDVPTFKRHGLVIDPGR